MNLRFLLVLLGVALPLLAKAELSPAAYASMRATAPECYVVEILGTHTSPGWLYKSDKTSVKARVIGVVRSSAGIVPGDEIRIRYRNERHPAGWVGPAPIPVPFKNTQYKVYLKSSKGKRTFEPAAGSTTFVTGTGAP
jgi:hypothetical protein